jgi:PAS domain-containing protein
LVGLPLPVLWGRYLAVGGSSPLQALAARIAGEVSWSPREELFLAVALNDALIEESLLPLDPLEGFLRAGVSAGDQPVSVPPAGPEPGGTEGARTGEARVADLDALRRRARNARASARRIREATREVQQLLVATTPSRPGGHAHLTRKPTDGQRFALVDARRLEALLQGQPQVFWRADAAGRMQQDSPTWLAFTGQCALESADHGWLDAVHPADRRHAEENWRACVARDMPVRTHFRLWNVTADDWQLTLVRAVPLHDPGGRTSGWVGTNTVVGTIGRHPAGIWASARQMS